MEVAVQRAILPPMRWSLRVWLAVAVLPGCVHFHPRNPPWRKDQNAAAAEASTKDAAGGDDAAAPARAASKGPVVVWRNVGQSVEGRPLRVTTVGYGPRRVLWVGGIHGNEREGSVATAELPAALAARAGGLAAVTLTILEDANPDGSARNTRGNKNGVDLNRNFPAKNFKPHRMYGITPLSQPEAKALHDLVLQVEPHLVIVAHSWSNDRFINFDGPARHLAERFSRLSSFPVKASEDIAATPGSLGSWIGRTLGVPILTLEYRRGSDPEVAWQNTRVAILEVILDGSSVTAAPAARPAASVG
jgi:predicted deacylase